MTTQSPQGSWHYGDILDAVAAAVPDRVCLASDDSTTTWREFAAALAGVTGTLQRAGVGRQATVATCLPNGPEAVIALAACLTGSFVPANVNYRYESGEITYLLKDSDAEAVVFPVSLVDQVSRAREECPAVRLWLAVEDSGRAPAWAVPFSAATAAAPGYEPVRASDDVILLYTGGTTGLPKGVVWTHDSWFRVNGLGALPPYGLEPVADLAGLVARLPGVHITTVPCSPVVHAAGFAAMLTTLTLGGTVVTLPGGRYDGPAVLEAVRRHDVGVLMIVGDAFARPLIEALSSGGSGLDSLRMIASSGAMLSADVRADLERLLPGVAVVDGYGSSEAPGLGNATGRPSASGVTSFVPAAKVGVFTAEGSRVAPGSAEPGLVAVSGDLPLGYRNDAAKTASVFREFEGERWLVTGDWARVLADGSVELLGRGSACINTGGEKVFPEEVEQALKADAGVLDAACVGVPDVQFGEIVVALVVPQDLTSPPAADQLQQEVKRRIAAYKAPKRIVMVDALERTPAGKLNYPALRRQAIHKLDLNAAHQPATA